MNCQFLNQDNILLRHGAVPRVVYNFVGQASAVLAVVVRSRVLSSSSCWSTPCCWGRRSFSWLERRLIGKFQNRLGPNRWGPFGMFQPIADLVKLLFKEDLTPGTADRWVFLAVPIMMVAPS